MLSLSISPAPPAQKKKLKFLETQFPKLRETIETRPFARLPWEDFSEGSNPSSVPKKISNLYCIGMGGSSLGAKALASGLHIAALQFLDNIDPDSVAREIKNSKTFSRDSFFLLISKSGETIEVLALASLLLPKIRSRQALILTDKKESSLGRIAQKYRIPIIPTPEDVPGRFSVLSVAGLLPIHLAQAEPGLAQDVLKGARLTNFHDAWNLACQQFLHYKDGKNIVVIFPYAEELSDFSDWYIQLLAESIGKSKTVGITPVKAMGARDQHSQLQLFLDGPSDKFFIFITKENPTLGTSLKLPGKTYTLADLYRAQYQGVKRTFQKRKIPYAEITVPRISPETLGELFFFFELEVAFLGLLFNVNTESQPAVEQAKKITKSLLK